MRARLAVSFVTVLGLSSAALADQLVLEFNSIYSGSGTPAQGSPYARATFTSNTPGTVTMLLEGLLASSEFMSKVFFNFDPSKTLANLSVSHTSGTAPSAMDIAANTYNAGGGGRHDIKLSFPTANASRFNGTDTSLFTFTSSEMINASSFNFLSAPHGGHGPFITAAHIQGLSGGGSVWVSGEQPVLVPLPAGAWSGLAAMGVIALGTAGRRRLVGRQH